MTFGKPPYVSRGKSDNTHKTKASQRNLRGFVVTRTGIEPKKRNEKSLWRNDFLKIKHFD